MDIKINMLNVKDGDAIIIELLKESKSLVIVIDGGEPGYYQTRVKPTLIPILNNHEKKAPDIVVCTHYDSDHIGGLILLLEDYIYDIKEVWVHKTPELIQGYIKKAKSVKEGMGMYLSTNLESFSFQKLFEGYNNEQRPLLEEKANIILESLPQLKKLIDLIPASKLKQVFNDKKHPLPDWQEISVLGPTKEYFDKLFPSTKSFEEFIREEATVMLDSGKERSLMLERAGLGPCERLKSDSVAKITATNKASIILAIDNINMRYLFTGDAGIESFKAIPKWESELKELYFLKIPHHASDNNISKELIGLMNPIYAYSSGFKYQDDDVLKCIEEKSRNKEVKSTKSSGDLVFPCSRFR